MAPNTANAPPKKPTLASFRRKVQNHISLDDREWKFQVPNLPPARELDQRRLVKTLSLLTTNKRNEIVLTLETALDNRAIRGDPLNRFLVVSIAEFRAQPRAQGSQSSPSDTRDTLQPVTPREFADYATKLLKAGVTLQGVHYNFYGHSNSQLKSRTCFLYAAPKEIISRKVEALGDFAKMKTVAKKAKRIGLLFSTAKVAMIVSPDRVEDIPDIESADYIFTDGCGMIAPVLAQELSRRVGIVFRDRRYTPSVMQIRYRGYKGVVTVDPTMSSDKKTLLKLRKSMKKFAGGDDHSFSVVEHSKVSNPGHELPPPLLTLSHSRIPTAFSTMKSSFFSTLLASTVPCSSGNKRIIFGSLTTRPETLGLPSDSFPLSTSHNSPSECWWIRWNQSGPRSRASSKVSMGRCSTKRTSKSAGFSYQNRDSCSACVMLGEF
jgi:regulator of nonsense transcripts 1